MNRLESQIAAIEETPEPHRAEHEAPASPDLDDPSLYFNRELSWLDFNDRVLQLAEDPAVPLLERAKFSAIWESNMDEFFMVRVANVHDQIDAGISARGADGMTPPETLAAIRARVIGQRERVGRNFERDLRPALSEQGIRIVTFDAATAEEMTELERLFVNQVFPVLTPLVIGRGRPFPYISNLSLSLAVVLRDPDQDDRDPRPRQGAEGAARPLPEGRRERRDPGPARRPDRGQHRLSLPRHGGRSTRRSSG